MKLHDEQETERNEGDANDSSVRMLVVTEGEEHNCFLNKDS